MSEPLIKRYSLSKQVCDDLERKIENGDYKIGDKIPPEPELMTIYNVSRNTIREAIQSLTSAGIVRVQQGDGTYVKCNNRFDANMTMKLAKASYNEINEARKALEISIASLAAVNANKTEVAAIKRKLEKRQSANESEKENTLADIAFHMEIAKSCHNNVLLDLYKSLYSFLVKHIHNRSKSHGEDPETVNKYHEELFNAIENHDKELAETFAKKILEL